MGARKILLVQLYSNGDCLFATAVARQIKQDYPGCHLTWAIASFCKNTIANNPYVDNVLEVDWVVKGSNVLYRTFKKQILERKKAGEWDDIFFTNTIDDSWENYDDCIRYGIFRGYKKELTVPIKPVLCLYDDEIARVKEFANKYYLSLFRDVILFEFSPQSQQSNITKDLAITIAEKLTTTNKDVAVILSSPLKIEHASLQIIDGSELSFRENAALTHYCTLLVGCSSGITWISTSNAAKELPMIQLVSKKTTVSNSVQKDCERFNLSSDKLINIVDYNEEKLVNCVNQSLHNWEQAKKIYSQHVPINFNAVKYVVHFLLSRLRFAAVVRYIRKNKEVYGNDFRLYKEVIKAIVMFPLRIGHHMLFGKKA